MLRRYGFLLVVLFLASCVAARENPTATPPPASPTVAALNPTAVISTPTPEKALVAKQKDLLFIEFFSIT